MNEREKLTHAADQFGLPLPQTADEVTLLGEALGAIYRYREAVHERQAAAYDRLEVRLRSSGAATLGDMIDAATPDELDAIRAELRLAGYPAAEVDEATGQR